MPEEDEKAKSDEYREMVRKRADKSRELRGHLEESLQGGNNKKTETTKEKRESDEK